MNVLSVHFHSRLYNDLGCLP